MVSILLVLVAGLGLPFLIALWLKATVWRGRPPADRLTWPLFGLILLVGASMLPGMLAVIFAERWYAERKIREWCAEHGYSIVSMDSAHHAGNRRRRWDAMNPWRMYAVTLENGRVMHVRHGDTLWGRWSNRVELVTIETE